MKFIYILLIGLGGLMVGTHANAQKSAYIDVEEVVSLLPDLDKVNVELQHFQTDSLNVELKNIVDQYKYIDSMTRIDSVRIPPAVRRENMITLQNLAYQIQNWDALSQRSVNNKRNYLLNPIYAKVYEAIRTAAKENGYAFVYDKNRLIIAPKADDLMPFVARKLNIKLPEATTGPQQASH